MADSSLAKNRCNLATSAGSAARPDTHQQQIEMSALSTYLAELT
jgi:hypothetical protein